MPLLSLEQWSNPYIIHTYIWLSMHWLTHTLRWEIKHRHTSEETSLLCINFPRTSLVVEVSKFQHNAIRDCLPQLTDMVHSLRAFLLFVTVCTLHLHCLSSENLERRDLRVNSTHALREKHMFHFRCGCGVMHGLQRAIYKTYVYVYVYVYLAIYMLVYLSVWTYVSQFII